ncbi:translocation/assembly module TamB domain-containing protein [Acidimangrovimonas pyrenivorans]|uniref:Translocation/assembly module TamB domain-containing protein n=1 Tax=Acidimangrovimonas pyrenivorans TaxID=2030798 RepID=A0ABV7ACF1_9RHOB
MRILVLLLLFLPSLAWGQDGGGYLTSLLEDNLSGAGRQVKIEGFVGALSSKATMKQLTIADDKGIWLTLKGVTLDWSRSALLGGRVEVNELSAAEIDLPRLPQSSAPASTAPPSAEASGFSLPELPVSISIGKIEAKKVVLGAPVLGQAATVAVQGSLSLAGGEGATDISLKRIDGKEGVIALKASYANASRQLALDLNVSEGADGIMTNLIGLPGAPALELTAKGTGPLEDYSADIRLATDGQERLTGTVKLASSTDDAGTTRHFSAEIGGDIAPLFAPDYRAFFGPDIQLAVTGAQLPSGVTELSQMQLTARQITLAGKVTLAPDGLPQFLDISGQMAAADGAPVLLPIPGQRTRVGRADLLLKYDAGQGDGWSGRLALSGLERPGLKLAQATLTGSGTIAHQGTTPGAVDGSLRVAVSGLAPEDQALGKALGSALQAATGFRWQQGKPLQLSDLRLTGADYGLTASADVSGIGAALFVEGKASARADDLSRFAALAGRPLAGKATAQIDGKSALLAGSFDATARIDGTGLQAGQPELDALLQGPSHIALSAKRDTTGTTLRQLTIRAASLSADAEGVLKTGANDLRASLAFSDLGQLGKGYGGSLKAQAQYVEADGTGSLTLDGTGTDLALGQATADRLLKGETKLSLKARRTKGVIHVDHIDLFNPQLSAQAKAVAGDASRRVDLSAKLNDLALIAPGLPGPVTTEGTITDDGKGYAVDLNAKGPGGIDATVKGRVAADFASAKLSVSGSGRAEVANSFIEPRAVSGPLRFDLTLDGPPKLSSLSGRVTLNGARFVAPLLGLTADPMDVAVTLSGGSASVSGKLTIGGGTVTLSGPIDLSPPYASNLAVSLARVGLKDPELFATTVSGSMKISGPLAGGAQIAGRLGLGPTEIRVPSTGIGGSAAMPEGLVQKGASAAVRATLARAGVGTAASRPDKTPRRPFGLNITVSAPSQVFVRGRGLDAELGGQLSLTDTTADIVPIGGFDLRRGRLEILGKRLDLTQGQLRLEGRFVPYVHLEAANTSNGVTAIVTIDGDATDPQITFSSTPELPQEEVLAQLLFGRDLSKISAFQAAQLASAVATLAGKGGEGIVTKLRKGFGLDDLDIVTDATGNTSVKVGKYLSKNLYTDVTVGQDGTSEIHLNLDVSKSVTLRGKAGSDGNTGVGVFYERDY